MTTYTKTFDYMSDYLAYLDTAPNHRKDQGARVSSQHDEKGFFGDATYSQSVKLALDGYPEGREKLYEAAGDLASMVRPVSAFRREYDVAGMFPDIPRACSGLPDCMVNLGDTILQSKKVIKVFYNLTASCRVSPETMTNMGAAVLTAVDELESGGASVELWVGNIVESNNHNTHMLLRVKSAGEPLSIDNAAFPLVHPGMFRRLGFRFIEAQPVDHKGSYTAYGRLTDLNFEEREKHNIDVYIKGMVENKARVGCYETVMTAIRNQLNPKEAA